MLNPLVWNPFDEIAGLPLHPLVVHFAVVLLPLGALGLIALVAVPRWADRFAWPTLGALAGGTVVVLTATPSSGSTFTCADSDSGVRITYSMRACSGVWKAVGAEVAPVPGPVTAPKAGQRGMTKAITDTPERA